MKVIITGASGLLGRAVYKRFKAEGHEVKGLAHSRATGELVKIDLHDESVVEQFINDFRPDVVVHCAAERRPDVAEKDPQATKKLNVAVPSHLATLSKAKGFALIYISTDYVFDGNAPEGGYEPDAKTHPLNLYGETKLDGELAIQKAGDAARCITLRVPVLYGEVKENKESAINILMDGVQSGKSTKMDDYATRYPTLVDDVARVLLQISEALHSRKSIPQTVHFSSQKVMTKYQISLTFAKLLGVGSDHLLPQRDPPGPEETPRPRDCHLSNKALESAGINCSAVDFESWFKDYLKK